MGLNKNPKITSEYILSQVDEATIFSCYFGKFELGAVYNSVFREDKNASTGFYISSSGKIIYNDIATSEKLNCFAFVAKKFNTSYSKALIRVASDFGIIKTDKEPIFSKEQLNTVSEQVKADTNIKIQPDFWSEDNLKYWNDYEITQKELDDNKVFPVRKLVINDVVISNYSKDLRFAFILENEGAMYKKIYTPEAKDKKFKWINNIPLYLPFGFSDLPYTSDTLIITKSQKDRIIFKKYFTDVIAIQNESPASLRDKTVEYLKKKYKTIYINCDIDTAGQNAIAYFESKGFIPLSLPLQLINKGIKDCADFVKQYGLKRFEDFLKYKQLI